MNDVKMFCDFLDRNKNIEPIQSYLTFIKDNYMIIPLQVPEKHLGCYIFPKDIFELDVPQHRRFFFDVRLYKNDKIFLAQCRNENGTIHNFNDVLTILDKNEVGYGKFGEFNEKIICHFYINFTTIDDVINCFRLFKNVYLCIDYKVLLANDKHERVNAYSEKLDLFENTLSSFRLVVDHERQSCNNIFIYGELLFRNCNKKYDNVIQKMKEEYYNYLSEIKITKVMNEINRLKFMISKKDIIVKLTEFFENKEFITKDEFNKIKKDFE